MPRDDFAERQAQRAAIERWRATFKRAGFGDHAIDFSWVRAHVINAMGAAVEAELYRDALERQSGG